MQEIKYILMFISMFLIIVISKIVSKKYVDRVNELKKIQNALNIFKSKIKFTYEPIGEIFEEISNAIEGNIGEIFLDAKDNMKTEMAGVAWEDAVNSSGTSLTNEDKQTLKMLSKLLRTNRYRWSN